MIIDQRLINELRENTQKRKFFDKCENTFSIDKKSEFQSFNPSPYSQGKTGCCWLLSALMCISLFIEHSYGIKLNENTAFSKTYLMFYDKLERATLFIKEYSENLNNNNKVYAKLFGYRQRTVAYGQEPHFKIWACSAYGDG